MLLVKATHSGEEVEHLVPRVHGVDGDELVIVQVLRRLLERVLHRVCLLGRSRGLGSARGINLPHTEAEASGGRQETRDWVVGGGAWRRSGDVLAQLSKHGHEGTVVEHLEAREGGVLHLLLLRDSSHLEGGKQSGMRVLQWLKEFAVAKRVEREGNVPQQSGCCRTVPCGWQREHRLSHRDHA